MRNLRFPRLPGILILFAFAPGCQVLYRYRPLPVLVRDAETKKPIPDAQLHLSYPLARDSLAPFDSVDKTDAAGIAHLRAAPPYGGFGAHIEASAPGYAAEQMDIATESIQHLQPPQLFETTQKRPAVEVVDLYAEPHFAVEVVLPVGYRGPIEVVRALRDDVAAPPGQRCFRFQAVNGQVRIDGPSLLRRVYPSDYSARFADGTPLTGATTPANVGFRWLRSEGGKEVFLVGSQSEYDMERRYAPSETAPHVQYSTSSSEGGGGRGGRHHRGGD